jgi:hypothetical protein
VGFNVGFQFPRDPYDCDRGELIQFIEERGGNVFSCGGHPGAEVLAIFKDIPDVESANRKLPSLVSEISEFMEQLTGEKP